MVLNLRLPTSAPLPSHLLLYNVSLVVPDDGGKVGDRWV